MRACRRRGTRSIEVSEQVAPEVVTFATLGWVNWFNHRQIKVLYPTMLQGD